MCCYRCSLLRILVLAALCLPVFASRGTALESPVLVEPQGTGIEIQAEGVPLADVLKALASKTGLSLKLEDPLTETVTIHIQTERVEDVIRRLLTRRSYTLLYRKTSEGGFTPAELRVLGGRAGSSMPSTSTTGNAGSTTLGSLDQIDAEAPPPDPAQKAVKREWYQNEFADPRKLSEAVAAEPVVEGPHQRGIEITRLSEDSVLAQLGLSPGDVVTDVNGNAVASTQQFLQALQSLPQNQSMLRIERERNGQVDPIYIQFE